MVRSTAMLAAVVVCCACTAEAQLQVISTSPLRNRPAAPDSSVSITFDRALDPSSIDASSFRVFGRSSGAKAGTRLLSNGDKTVTMTPSTPFFAGETVLVNLSHDLRGADATPLRSAGYAFSFQVRTAWAPLDFELITTLSTRSSPLAPTTIYGALGADLNGDGYVDLTTINEATGDLRVFLNQADGSGLFAPFLTPVPLAGAASPHAPADFDNDGMTDVCVSTPTNKIFAALGNGDGTFQAAQSLTAGNEPEGVAVLDLDGDGDLDIANATHLSSQLVLYYNDGTGTFGTPTSIAVPISAGWALAAGDMNNDGITDLVLGGRDTQKIGVLLANGDGTFTAMPIRNSTGWTWHIALGDVDGDGNLDVAAANNVISNGAILRGQGDGTLGAAETVPLMGIVLASALGDLDGDGDLDWVLSAGQGAFRVFINDGEGHFTFLQDLATDDVASCATLADLDNDGDLDVALSDEASDHVSLYRNGVSSPLPCPATPPTCTPPVAGKARLTIHHDANTTRNQMMWKWKGPVAAIAEFGTPLLDTHYTLCVYDDGALVASATAAAGGTCAGSPCWRAVAHGYELRDKEHGHFGVEQLQLGAGPNGQGKIRFRGRGVHLQTPTLDTISGPIDVRLIQSTNGTCWAATYSAPFLKNAGGRLKARSD